MPDIEKLNNVAVADISKLDSITFADGQKVNNQSVSLVTDAHTLISTPLSMTTSDTAISSLDITSGIDSTYDVYEFIFTNMHGETDTDRFCFQAEVGTGTTYGQTITSTMFRAYHYEGDSGAGLGYFTSGDQAQGTALQHMTLLAEATDADSSISGKLTLYAPSSGTYVKHFMAETNHKGEAGGEAHYSGHALTAGYINTTTAITRIRFAFSSGDIHAGEIKMYGLAKS